MAREYKYHLQRKGKKLRCPSCGKVGEFVPYVDASERIVDGEIYGRCERINSCGYSKYPKLKEDKDWAPIPRKIEVIRPTEYISDELVQATFRSYKSNVFFTYLVRMFGGEKALEIAEMYNIGTATHGGTIFWQQDRQRRFRTAKVMYYNTNGKRDKNRKSWFVHSKIRPDFNFKQCFFGLHLVDGTKPVALCESEKTAIIMSQFMPEYIWIASGGSEMLSVERLAELPRLDYVFADNGQREKWEQKTKLFNAKMDTSVDKAVADGLLEPGSDILDLFLLKLNS